MIFQTDLCLRVFSGVVTLQRSILTLYFNLHLNTWYLHKIIRLILSEGIVFINKTLWISFLHTTSFQLFSAKSQGSSPFVCLFVFFFDLERYHLKYIEVNVCGEQWSMDHPCQKVFFTSTSGYSVMRFYLDFLFFKHKKKIRRVSGTELYYKETYFGVRCEWSLMQCLHYKFYHVALCCIILPVFVNIL